MASKKFREVKKAHDKILKKTKEVFEKGNNVVLDYIIFGRYLEFFKKFKKEFGKNLVIKILFPSKKEMIKRDIKRKCWTTGIERIESVSKEFKKIKNKIGKETFLDTSFQTPKETSEIIFQDVIQQDW